MHQSDDGSEHSISQALSSKINRPIRYKPTELRVTNHQIPMTQFAIPQIVAALVVCFSAPLLAQQNSAAMQQATPNEILAPQNATEFSGPGSLGWWSPIVNQPMRQVSTPVPLTLDEILVRALQHSAQIRVFSELPMIRRTAIIEADAAFDWSRFLETRWDDLNDPVGNSLTVGGTGTRYVNQQWTATGGLRRRTRGGGQLDISQQTGHQDTNSTFFTPNPQGTARLALGFTQPLMRGRGRVYNESLTVLAQLDSRIADDEFRRQVQSHLLEVTRAYWSLYLERGVLVQKMTSYQRANEIYQMLEKRREVDAQASQIISAKASSTTRYAELIRARMAVKNAESKIRALVNDPGLGQFDEVEIIPIDMPVSQVEQPNMMQSVEFAVQNRPEVLQAIKQIQAGQIRLGMSINELLPQLDLITQTYVAGLEGDGDIARAWGNQFDQGRPGYSVGLNYEIPVGNRAASARNTRRRLELRQLNSQYATSLQTVKLEVEVAVREIETSGQELSAKNEAMTARAAQLTALTKRWEQLPGEDVSAALALENLLVSQERLAEAEFNFLESQLTYNLALMNLKRATGLLLRTEGVQVGETTQDGLPTQVLSKVSMFQGQPETFQQGSMVHGIHEHPTGFVQPNAAPFQNQLPQNQPPHQNMGYPLQGNHGN